jgi:hypothetical protein
VIDDPFREIDRYMAGFTDDWEMLLRILDAENGVLGNILKAAKKMRAERDQLRAIVDECRRNGLI